MSALLDALSYVGDALDKPGRAIRGGLAGRPDELLAAIPFSDSLGLTDQANAVSGRDLLGQAGLSTGNHLLDEGLGFGAEMVLDPTTYLGAGIAARLGGKAGRALEGAARARGPGYATTMDDVLRDPSLVTVADRTPVPSPRRLEQVFGDGPAGAADNMEIVWDPDQGLVIAGATPPPPIAAVKPPAERQSAAILERISGVAPEAAAEVPPGSSLLGNGQFGVAFRTPAGDVVRLEPQFAGKPTRPAADFILQPTRTVDYAGRTPGSVVRVERMPMAGNVADLDHFGRRVPHPEGGLQTRTEALEREAGAAGLNFWDSHLGNVGTHGGRDVVIDPGAVDVMAEYAGGFAPLVGAGEPSALSRRLLDLLGGQPAMRRALDAGRAAPQYDRNLSRLGAVAGLGLGAT